MTEQDEHNFTLIRLKFFSVSGRRQFPLCAQASIFNCSKIWQRCSVSQLVLRLQSLGGISAVMQSLTFVISTNAWTIKMFRIISLQTL